MRRLTAQHLVQHASEAIDVAAAVELLTARRLLRAHVPRGTDDEPGLGQPIAAGCGNRSGDPKVGNQRMTAAQEDVLRLDVAVDHVMAVGVAERVCYLAGQLQRLVERELPFADQTNAQRRTFNIGHDVVEEAIRLARVVEREDVWVGEPRRDLDFPEKPFRLDRLR